MGTLQSKGLDRNVNLKGCICLRMIRGVKKLVQYLTSINCPMSEATIYRLVKNNSIPFRRPSPGLLLFNLDTIDKWLTGEENKHP